jgi:hypothetical protein
LEGKEKGRGDGASLASWGAFTSDIKVKRLVQNIRITPIGT